MSAYQISVAVLLAGIMVQIIIASLGIASRLATIISLLRDPPVTIPTYSSTEYTTHHGDEQ
jgi:hypothetical protein